MKSIFWILINCYRHKWVILVKGTLFRYFREKQNSILKCSFRQINLYELEESEIRQGMRNLLYNKMPYFLFLAVPIPHSSRSYKLILRKKNF